MYKLQRNDAFGRPSKPVVRLSDNAIIPPGNDAYQEYLDWLAEGNEPLPADEPAQ